MKLGRYQCTDQIGGSGGFETYRARVRGLAGDRSFAVKVLRLKRSEVPAAVSEPFLQNARRSAMLTETRIARVVEADSGEGLVFAVTPFMDGVDLAQFLERAREADEALHEGAGGRMGRLNLVAEPPCQHRRVVPVPEDHLPHRRRGEILIRFAREYHPGGLDKGDFFHREETVPVAQVEHVGMGRVPHKPDEVRTERLDKRDVFLPLLVCHRAPPPGGILVPANAPELEPLPVELQVVARDPGALRSLLEGGCTLPEGDKLAQLTTAQIIGLSGTLLNALADFEHDSTAGVPGGATPTTNIVVATAGASYQPGHMFKYRLEYTFRDQLASAAVASTTSFPSFHRQIVMFTVEVHYPPGI